MAEALQASGIAHAEIVLPAGRLSDTLPFFIETLGFQLDSIMPADDPRVAHVSGHGLNIVLDPTFQGEAGVIQLRTIDDTPREPMTAPNGTRILFAPANPGMTLPALQPSLSLVRFDAGDTTWKVGRAGMQYRDLIPDRQGGQFIASHIRIPDGGPVADNVHHHEIRLQLIYCYRGWVRLVYEDQGEPFVMRAGDCVLQPPHIRHRVLEASDGLEVIEIGSPAEHLTQLDHQMPLPTGNIRPGRDFNGQRFAFHQAREAQWMDHGQAGTKRRDLGIAEATGGLADVHVIRRAEHSIMDETVTFQNHRFVFAFVLAGTMSLAAGKQPATTLSAGDAFVVPQGMQQQFSNCSPDWQLLRVVVPN